MTTYYLFGLKGGFRLVKQHLGKWVGSVLFEDWSSKLTSRFGEVEYLAFKVKREREIETYSEGKVAKGSPLVPASAIFIGGLQMVFARLIDAETIRKFTGAFQTMGLDLERIEIDLKRAYPERETSGFGPEVVAITGIRLMRDERFEVVGRTLETSKDWFAISKAEEVKLDSLTLRLDIENLPVLVTLRSNGSILLRDGASQTLAFAVFSWVARQDFLHKPSSVISH